MKMQILKHPEKFNFPILWVYLNNTTFSVAPPPHFMLNSELPFQFRAEISPTVSSDYLKIP